MNPLLKKKKHPLGIALGSGGARGLAHIGVLEELESMGIVPDIVAGTSIGSIVGAGYCAGQLREMRELALNIDLRTFLFKIMDFGMPRSGLVEGKRVQELLEEIIGNSDFSDLSKPFRCIAADLKSGEEIVFTEGPLLHAIRASISIPGIFTPVKHGERFLVDGGLVNPIPVDQLKAMGARKTIAVDVNKGTLGKLKKKSTAKPEKSISLSAWRAKMERKAREQESRHLDKLLDWFKPDPTPHLIDVLGDTLHIVENQVGQVRMKLYPPDICLTPAVGDVDVLDFHHAEQIVQAGRDCVRQRAEELREKIG